MTEQEARAAFDALDKELTKTENQYDFAREEYFSAMILCNRAFAVWQAARANAEYGTRVDAEYGAHVRSDFP